LLLARRQIMVVALLFSLDGGDPWSEIQDLATAEGAQGLPSWHALQEWLHSKLKISGVEWLVALANTEKDIKLTCCHSNVLNGAKVPIGSEEELHAIMQQYERQGIAAIQLRLVQ